MRNRDADERLRQALEESQLTRRDLLRRGIVVGASFTALPAVVAACGGDDDGGRAAAGTAAPRPGGPG